MVRFWNDSVDDHNCFHFTSDVVVKFVSDISSGTCGQSAQIVTFFMSLQ